MSLYLHPTPWLQAVPSYPGIWLGGGKLTFCLDQLAFSPLPALSSAVSEGLSGWCTETSNQKPGLYRSYSQKGHEKDWSATFSQPSNSGTLFPLPLITCKTKQSSSKIQTNDSGLNRYRQRNQGTG